MLTQTWYPPEPNCCGNAYWDLYDGEDDNDDGIFETFCVPIAEIPHLFADYIYINGQGE